jgi:magnesium-transporting ATPase (P-type)
LDVAGHYLELTGTSHPPRRSTRIETPDPAGRAAAGSDRPGAGRRGALCNDASLQPDPQTGRYGVIGDPTEGALLVAAQQAVSGAKP